MQSVYVLLLFGGVGYVLVKLGFPLAASQRIQRNPASTPPFT